MEEYHIKIDYCLSRIKDKLKCDGIAYKVLAEQMNVSLITVKRLLNGSDISMQKLLKICDLAGVDFSELWQSAMNKKSEHYIFTYEQDEAFFRYPHLLSFFDELVTNDGETDAIQKKWSLSDASVYLYLRKLEAIGLIQLSVQQRVSILASFPMGFGPDSKVVKKQIADDLMRVRDRYITTEHDQEFKLVKPLQLNPELREKMYQELIELISRYGELSEKYFLKSEYAEFNLVVCDYDTSLIKDDSAQIINVNGFE